ncbi:MAG: cold shock domain-containing protein [Acidimicrobiales bacterium]
MERFDAEVGLGVIAADDGDRVDFHCTAIADGTRTIDEGAAVTFVVGWAGPGRWEARRVLATVT